MVGEREKDAAHDWSYEAAVEKATGIAWKDAPDETDDQHEEYWAIRATIPSESSDPELVVWHDIQSRLFPVVCEILTHKATMLAELAVQTNAIVQDRSDGWDNDNYEGYGNSRLFLESLRERRCSHERHWSRNHVSVSRLIRGTLGKKRHTSRSYRRIPKASPLFLNVCLGISL